MKKTYLSNPAPGENLLSGNLIMETGCSHRRSDGNSKSWHGSNGMAVIIFIFVVVVVVVAAAKYVSRTLTNKYVDIAIISYNLITCYVISYNITTHYSIMLYYNVTSCIHHSYHSIPFHSACRIAQRLPRRRVGPRAVDSAPMPSTGCSQ